MNFKNNPIFQKVQLKLVVAGVTALFTLSQFAGRNRISHNNGIVTRGKLRIVDNPTFPKNDFFQAGKEFPCRFRFSTIRLYDDASLAARSIAIKFADTRYKSPLDMELNTGTMPLFSNASNFLEFIKLTVKGSREHFLPYWAKYPKFRTGADVSVRRKASSFLQMYYYSQTPLLFVDQSGKKYYVKYRAIPKDRGAESGLPSAKDIKTTWIQHPLPGETRHRNYLKDEVKVRVQNKDAGMILQLQLREIKSGDSNDICDPNILWDEEIYPWHDLATAELDDYLSYEEGQLHIFSLGASPPSLGILPVKSIYDYNSIVLMRVRSMPAKRARLFAYKLFGMPEPIPNEREIETSPTLEVKTS
ncbi:MAG: hypothetical protein KDE51_17070 [Anaerolineales bacterium]|nr:hypothetical protein [Anaerolineales bacterium]